VLSSRKAEVLPSREIEILSSPKAEVLPSREVKILLSPTLSNGRTPSL
jgi:hypothetical protein